MHGISESKKLFDKAAGEMLPAWEDLCATSVIMDVPKGEEIFALGQWQPYIYVVRSGIVKLSYRNEEGEEWIKAFVGEGDFFACPSVIIAGQPTDFCAYALADACIERLDYATLQALNVRYPAWQKATRSFMELHIFRKEKRERELLTMTAEKRYRAFLSANPALAGRLQQRDIAHFLGITPEALSRIRKRLRGEAELLS